MWGLVGGKVVHACRGCVCLAWLWLADVCSAPAAPAEYLIDIRVIVLWASFSVQALLRILETIGSNAGGYGLHLCRSACT